MIKPVSFGLALGILWGVVLMFCIILTKFTSYPEPDFYTPLQSIYFGIEISWFGALFGAICGFIDGFCGGLVFAWLYNLFARE